VRDFDFSFLDVFRQGFKCLRKNSYQDFIVREGLTRFNKELNVFNYLKKLRLGVALGEVTLSNFQRELIPYFNSNVLGFKPTQLNTSLNSHKRYSILLNNPDSNDNLKQLVKISKHSVTDSRIIQCLLENE